MLSCLNYAKHSNYAAGRPLSFMPAALPAPSESALCPFLRTVCPYSRQCVAAMCCHTGRIRYVPCIPLHSQPRE
ncbi:hypothetical protein Defa_04210 [Desulfovibrio sp. TH_2024_36128]|uniref:WAP domain-containing protein n=1 Tax=Desulfovibrio falkowii TaxID=3136602 RepID=A0ABQ0E5B9_9BACT